PNELFNCGGYRRDESSSLVPARKPVSRVGGTASAGAGSSARGAGAASFETRTQQIRSEWRTQMGRIRANSAADLLVISVSAANGPVVKVRPSPSASNCALPGSAGTCG